MRFSGGETEISNVALIAPVKNVGQLDILVGRLVKTMVRTS